MNSGMSKYLPKLSLNLGMLLLVANNCTSTREQEKVSLIASFQCFDNEWILLSEIYNGTVLSTEVAGGFAGTVIGIVCAPGARMLCKKIIER